MIPADSEKATIEEVCDENHSLTALEKDIKEWKLRKDTDGKCMELLHIFCVRCSCTYHVESLVRGSVIPCFRVKAFCCIFSPHANFDFGRFRNDYK